MTALSLNSLSPARFSAIFSRVESSAARSLALEAPRQDTVLIAAILITLQIFDGVLTAFGVFEHGTAAEGNLLLRWLMENIGVINSLILVKSIAVLVVFTLCMLASKVSWLGDAMLGIISVYIGAAVIPWGLVLFKLV